MRFTTTHLKGFFLSSWNKIRCALAHLGRCTNVHLIFYLLGFLCDHRHVYWCTPNFGLMPYVFLLGCFLCFAKCAKVRSSTHYDIHLFELFWRGQRWRGCTSWMQELRHKSIINMNKDKKSGDKFLWFISNEEERKFCVLYILYANRHLISIQFVWGLV